MADATPTVKTAVPADAPKPDVVLPVAAAKPAPVATKASAEAKPAPAAPVKARAASPAPATAAPAKTAPAKPVAKAEPVPAPAPAKPVKSAVRRKPAAKKTVTPTKIAAKAATAHKETTMTTTDKAKTMIADANTRTKAAMEKSQQMFGEMNEFSKGNVEAIVESSKIAAKGIESMGQDAAAYAKKAFEEATATAKQMASIKSPTEFMKLQSDFFRSSFDAMVAQSSKSTETMLKLAGEVAQPISNRVSMAAEKIKVSA
ncbi:MAG: phasin family protein [Sphingomonas bacterium]|nr:phasin family protein [Sphingomonas bacterium]